MMKFEPLNIEKMAGRNEIYEDQLRNGQIYPLQIAIEKHCEALKTATTGLGKKAASLRMLASYDEICITKKAELNEEELGDNHLSDIAITYAAHHAAAWNLIRTHSADSGPEDFTETLRFLFLRQWKCFLAIADDRKAVPILHQLIQQADDVKDYETIPEKELVRSYLGVAKNKHRSHLYAAADWAIRNGKTNNFLYHALEQYLFESVNASVRQALLQIAINCEPYSEDVLLNVADMSETAVHDYEFSEFVVIIEEADLAGDDFTWKTTLEDGGWSDIFVQTQQPLESEEEAQVTLATVVKAVKEAGWTPLHVAVNLVIQYHSDKEVCSLTKAWQPQ